MVAMSCSKVAVKSRASLLLLRVPRSTPCLSFTPTDFNSGSTTYRIMSDSEPFDIDDELLELAGASEKKRKRKQEGKPSSKRRRQEYVPADKRFGMKLMRNRANMSDESSSPGPESEDEEEEVNPYPLEGKYKDEDDRERYGVFRCKPVEDY